MQVQLIVANEQHQGRVVPINIPKFTIGRSEECNLRSRSPQVSRHHCTILLGDDTVIVQDLGGENGTFVNGNRISAIHSLKDGDKLVVGSHSFIVSIKAGGGKPQENQQDDDQIELTPSSIVPSSAEGSVTQSADAASKTVSIQPKEPERAPETMFEIRFEGRRVSVTKSRLFELARKGSVLPDDLITVAGTKVFADSIQGIVFGNEASASSPATPLPRTPLPQTPATSSKASPAPAAESDPFNFADFGDTSDSPNPFDDIASGPVVRVAKKESAFGAIWKALDISFSRVYTMEGNNLVIHSVKALYYVIVVVCFLLIFFSLVNFCTDWIQSEGEAAFLRALQKHFIGLATATFGGVTIIVIVRVLIEMLLLAWLESAKQEQDKKDD